MMNAQINMARLVETQKCFAIECDGFLIGYNEDDDTRLVIQSGPMVVTARPEHVQLIQDPPHLAIITADMTACVDITHRLSSTLLSLYGGACQ